MLYLPLTKIDWRDRRVQKYDSAESGCNKHFKIRMFVCYIWLDCYNINTKKLYYKLKFKLL
jgi:hypothetical protein